MTTVYVLVLLFLLLLTQCSNIEKAGTPFAPEVNPEKLKSHDCLEIQVTWNPARLQSGSSVTSYLAEVKEQNSSESLYCTTPCGSSRQCTIQGLKAETDYIVLVSAKNSRGYGNPSPIKAIRTDPTGNLATIVGLLKYQTIKAVHPSKHNKHHPGHTPQIT